MSEILLGLVLNLDVSLYAKPEFSFSFMKEIKKALLSGFDLYNIELASFDEEQFRYICYGLQDELDVSWYAKPEFDILQMEEIFLGLGEELDVEIYAKPEFDYLQMRQIRFGLENKVEIESYLNPGIKWEEMERIRLSLKEKQN